MKDYILNRIHAIREDNVIDLEVERYRRGFMKKILKSQKNLFPHLYTEIDISVLENRYPLKSGSDNQELFEDLSSTGLVHPIIVSYIGNRISTGHRRVHWAERNGYTHISGYKLRYAEDWMPVFNSTMKLD